MLLIIIVLLAAAGLYVNISYDHEKAAKDEFCRIECRGYSK